MQGTETSIPRELTWTRQPDGTYTATGDGRAYEIRRRGGRYLPSVDGVPIAKLHPAPGLPGYDSLANAKRLCQRQEVAS